MKAWFAVPAAAVAMTAALLMTPDERFASADEATGNLPPAGMVVLVANAGPALTMTDACVYSAEALAIGAPSQCGGASFVHAMVHTEERPDEAPSVPLEWPGDFFALTLGAAISAWDATMCFVGSLFDYAGEAGGLDI